MTPGVVRWYDGVQWTTRTAAIPVAPPPEPVIPVAHAPVTSAPVMPAGMSATIWTPQPLPGNETVVPSGGSAQAGPALATASRADGAGLGPVQARADLGYSRMGYAGTYVPVARADLEHADWGRSERRTAIGTLIAGLAVLVASTLLLRFASTNGGVIWTGGFVVGAGLLIRAGVAGRAARDKGGSGLGALTWTGAGVVVLVCGGLVVASLTTIFQPGLPTDPAVGSCFVDLGTEVELVRCADDHDLVALDLAASLDACPAATTAYVENAGLVVCMAPDTAATPS